MAASAYDDDWEQPNHRNFGSFIEASIVPDDDDHTIAHLTPVITSSLPSLEPPELARALSLDESPSASSPSYLRRASLHHQNGTQYNGDHHTTTGTTTRPLANGNANGTNGAVTLTAFANLTISTSSSPSSSAAHSSLSFPDESPSPSPTHSSASSPHVPLEHMPALFTLDRQPSFLELSTSSTRRSCTKGDKFDVLDTADKWVGGTVVDTRRSSVLRPHETKPVQQVLIHYEGWADRWNEWIDVDSARIAPRDSQLFHSIAGAIKALRAPAVTQTVMGVNHPRMQLTDLKFKDDNEVKDFAAALAANRSLAILYMSKNGLRRDTIGFFADALRINTTLHSLSLDNNLIDEEGLLTLCSGIEASQSMTKFDIRMPLGEIGLIALARMLTRATQLVKFKAVNVCNYYEHHNVYNYARPSHESEMRITDAYVAALATNTTLTSFGINIHQFSTNSIKRMLAVLCSRRNCVTDLDIPVSRELTMDEAAHLLPLFLRNTTLKELSFHSGQRVQQDTKPMGPGVAWLLKLLIDHHTTLSEILIRGYPFDEKHLPDMMASLRKNTRVVEFGYGPAMFQLGQAHAKQIQQILAVNQRTRHDMWQRELHDNLLVFPRAIASLITDYLAHRVKYHQIF